MTPVQQLISAIQSCSPSQLRQVVVQLNTQSDQEVEHLTAPERLWVRRSKIDDRMPGLGLTALHVAAKAYSAHAHDPNLASAFNQMVSDLLNAGASPFVAIGATYRTRMVPVMSKHQDPELGTFYGGKKLGERPETVVVDPGKTVVEVCEGKLPPALVSWLKTNINDTFKASGTDNIGVHSTTKVREAAALQKRKESWAQERTAARANFTGDLSAIRKRLARDKSFKGRLVG